ncbi:MAG: hypothetical protein KAW52_08975, partial [candidate division Zixibacteria bacterium]|nr:hypothetical protein [candidate division Zixibacteria bacterium]
GTNYLVTIPFQLSKMTKWALLSFGQNLNCAPRILRAGLRFLFPHLADWWRVTRSYFFVTTHKGNTVT